MNQTPRSRLLRVVTNPGMLGLASLVSVILWMPFGFGYYDFPWGTPFAVCLLIVFVIGFPMAAALACVRSLEPQFAPIRFTIALASLFIGLFGLFHMLNWITRFAVNLSA